MFWLYNILLTLTVIVWAPFVYFGSFKRKTKPNWRERMGTYDIPRGTGVRRVWVHAVSVGEFMAAKPILERLKTRLPEHEIVLSVTTSSGHDAATSEAGRRKERGEPSLYDRLVYYPLDVARFTLASMQAIRPEVICLMESELWWNFLWAAKVFDAEVLILNGRVSDRTFRRAMSLKFFYRGMLRSVDRALMQSEVDRKRIKALGADHAEVLGSSKFDEPIAGVGESKEALRQKFGLQPDRPTLVIGSTRGAVEEAFVAEALGLLPIALKGQIQIVWAPRHIERSEAVQEAATKAGFPARLRASSVAPAEAGEGQAVILNTYGELASVYGAADVAVVGGGFDALGGQNIIQPLVHGVPVLHGPNMQNFRDAARLAAEAGSARTCATPAELAAAIQDLLADPEERDRMGRAAKALASASSGAGDRYAAAVEEAVDRYWMRELRRRQRRDEIKAAAKGRSANSKKKDNKPKR